MFWTFEKTSPFHQEGQKGNEYAFWGELMCDLSPDVAEEGCI